MAIGRSKVVSADAKAVSQHATPKQWQRRALRAEAELESIRQMRQFEHGMEMDSHRMIAKLQVAIKEIKDILKGVEES